VKICVRQKANFRIAVLAISNGTRAKITSRKQATSLLRHKPTAKDAEIRAFPESKGRDRTLAVSHKVCHLSPQDCKAALAQSNRFLLARSRSIDRAKPSLWAAKDGRAQGRFGQCAIYCHPSAFPKEAYTA
jgi:hypothetical protein